MCARYPNRRKNAGQRKERRERKGGQRQQGSVPNPTLTPTYIKGKERCRREAECRGDFGDTGPRVREGLREREKDAETGIPSEISAFVFGEGGRRKEEGGICAVVAAPSREIFRGIYLIAYCMGPSPCYLFQPSPVLRHFPPDRLFP